MLNTIVRAGDVLTLFSRDFPEWGVREVSAHLGIPKSNAHELLSSLTEIGLLQRTAKSRYRLGWKLLSLTDKLVSGTGLHKIGMSVCQELAVACGESVQLAVYDGRDAVLVGRARGGRAPNIDISVGDLMTAHSTAAGKLLMAFNAAGSEIPDTVAESMFSLTRATITSPAALSRELFAIRRDNMSTDVDETSIGLSCVAVPIREMGTNDVIASLSISASTARMSASGSHYARAAAAAAKRLSNLLPSAAGGLKQLVTPSRHEMATQSAS